MEFYEKSVSLCLFNTVRLLNLLPTAYEMRMIGKNYTLGNFKGKDSSGRAIVSQVASPVYPVSYRIVSKCENSRARVPYLSFREMVRRLAIVLS